MNEKPRVCTKCRVTLLANDFKGNSRVCKICKQYEHADKYRKTKEACGTDDFKKQFINWNENGIYC